MNRTIDCPVCDGKAHLKPEQKTRTYRNEKFDVVEQFYQCNKCNYSFTNNEVDQYNLNLLHNKYREKYQIPFPDQLINIRESYGLTQSKMSEILGFGPNQYRLYESGDIPVGGNATVLNLIIEPKEFRSLLKKKKEFLKDDYERVLVKINKLMDGDFSTNLKNNLFPKSIVPDRYTGYKLPDFEKLANMVLFFLSNAPFKTRLNKLLSYADFGNFKYFGSSISGCKYAAIDMGSVPDQYAIIYTLMESSGYISTETVKINNDEVEKFVRVKEFDNKLFSKSELEIMQTVLDTFETKSTLDITKTSHKELGWIDNEKTKSRIDYSVYAPQLKAI